MRLGASLRRYLAGILGLSFILTVISSRSSNALMAKTWITITYGGLFAIALSDFVLVASNRLFRRGKQGLRHWAFVVFPVITLFASYVGSELAKWAYDTIWRVVSYALIGPITTLLEAFLARLGWDVAANFFILTILIALIVSTLVYLDLYFSYERATEPK
jgi:hypothetical protein